MNDKKTISRRGFLGAIAAVGSIGVAACGTQATNRASVASPDRLSSCLGAANLLCVARMF